LEKKKNGGRKGSAKENAMGGHVVCQKERGRTRRKRTGGPFLTCLIFKIFGDIHQGMGEDCRNQPRLINSRKACKAWRALEGRKKQYGLGTFVLTTYYLSEELLGTGGKKRGEKRRSGMFVRHLLRRTDVPNGQKKVPLRAPLLGVYPSRLTSFLETRQIRVYETARKS